MSTQDTVNHLRKASERLYEQRDYINSDLVDQAVELIEQLLADKGRLDWLEAHPESGAGLLAHKPAEERGHVYTNKKWKKEGENNTAYWDHFWAPTVRGAIDKAINT